MQLQPLGSNQTQLTFKQDDSSIVQVLFSYQTPVAALHPALGYIKTAKQWSVTTSRHINEWLDGVSAKIVDQKVLDEIVNV